MKALHSIAFILVIIGGINWLLTAFNWNLVHLILGGVPIIETIVYVLVGLSAIYLVFTHRATCRACEKSAMSSTPM